MRRAGAALVALLLVMAAPAWAQSQEIVGDMAGPYQIIPTDGGAACGIQLTAERIGDAWRARPDPNCAARVRASAAVVAWRPMDGIVLLDAKGGAAMTFVEDETALPSSPDLRAPKHYLVPRIAGYTRMPRPAELVGQWTLRSRGRAPCLITLKEARVGNGKPKRTIALGQGCAGKPLPGRLTEWSMEDMKIMLWGPDDIMLMLNPVADNRYIAEPGAWVLSR
ncbi:AprI/Inh family metalloprotease inhibitor [Sphingomonas sp. R-74633]|uniref:AprI/Inh family metalloprotease inhibitor n=1 Tax=Sphingomonas sp. R-74633 TaxID=2751188 RepID=UPI0015D445F8|nr:AprI/Inh family metalloprotease inhibitor [Sphingomonas sp. R-74633]NYT40755.1 AprI/Inh family metalloprotease inhibitor [Sphingomonas sp. R-74633]